MHQVFDAIPTSPPPHPELTEVGLVEIVNGRKPRLGVARALFKKIKRRHKIQRQKLINSLDISPLPFFWFFRVSESDVIVDRRP
jgi:hypothetical protein